MRLNAVLNPSPVQAPLAAQATVAQARPQANAPAVLAPTDRLKLSRTPALQKPANIFNGALALPKQRNWQDYQNIFKWVEKVTDAPIAYQDQRSQQAYIKSIKGKPQEYYDRKNFLNSIGVHGVETYGRDDSGVHDLLETIDYTPNSEEVSWGLRLAQKGFYWFFMHFPKTFDKIATLVDKYYFTRKDKKAQSWLKTPVPQPGFSPSDPLLPAAKVKAHYQNTLISQALASKQVPTTEQLFQKYFWLSPPKEIGLLFEGDFHMGTPKPGEAPQNYGTYAIATRLGFSPEVAKRVATADFDMDLNNTIYGKTDAFPNANPSRHFDLNKDKPEAGDTRYIWAQRYLDAAVELAHRGRFEEAERCIGYGLHGIQDSFAHGHIRLASHAITDNIPDGVDYNPVAAYEATLATIGYLNAYLQRLNRL